MNIKSIVSHSGAKTRINVFRGEDLSHDRFRNLPTGNENTQMGRRTEIRPQRVNELPGVLCKDSPARTRVNQQPSRQILDEPVRSRGIRRMLSSCKRLKSEHKKERKVQF